MAITINWSTKVINIPQADLIFISGTLYEADTDAIRLELKGIEASIEGMPFEDTHRHNTEVTISDVVYARTFEIINGYTITYEDGQYAVNMTGSNNNILDVLNRNQVSVASSNSAGLTTPGFTSEQVTQLTEIWQDRGLDINNPKTIDATTETAGLITKIRQKVAGILTVTRQ